MLREMMDPIHGEMFKSEHILKVWKDKYAYKLENQPKDTFNRVARAIMPEEPDLAYEAMAEGLFCPGGRILTGAGTDKAVTMMNCYVNETLDDSIEGILRGFGNTVSTLRRGGGIGTDFTPLRPRGSELKTLGHGAEASGPIPYMKMWCQGSATIKSAGERRGAMMTTLAVWHPDIEEFITCKHEKGVMTETNISVLVTDDFMEAVKMDLQFALRHKCPPPDRGRVEKTMDFGGEQYWVWKWVNARELWQKILRSTYEYSEPGVIFIDRVNAKNNLRDREVISCTNPCGEQPLPPNGCCLLGAVNLSRMILQPFTQAARINLELLRKVVELAIEFLDNVIDITAYPLEAQRLEELNKRRIGLGVMGLGDALAMIGFRYGSAAAINWTDSIWKYIREVAYRTSARLAATRGRAPIWQDGIPRYVYEGLSSDTQQLIARRGLRNSHLLNIAPTGTTALLFDNTSGGVEPIFALTQRRKILQKDNTWKEVELTDYAVEVWRKVHPGVHFDSMRTEGGMATTDQLTVQEHLKMQAVCQKHIDASVSKTINIPTDMSFEDFEYVYQRAYDFDCKGCTTYRPSAVRGSILESADKQTKSADERGMYIKLVQTEDEGSAVEVVTTRVTVSGPVMSKRARPSELAGVTHKIKWPTYDAAIYMTVNTDDEGVPLEVMINTKNAVSDDWIRGFTLMATAVMRLLGAEAYFIAEEWKQVHSAGNGAWFKDEDETEGRYYPSIIAYMGHILSGYYTEDVKASFTNTANSGEPPSTPPASVALARPMVDRPMDTPKCPKCGGRNLIRKEGCITCDDCGTSNCA